MPVSWASGQLWADPMLSDASWATIKTPALWETVGYDGMDGVAWYRTSFTLTDDEARQAVRLSLGPIDDSDITWVNGVEVGRTTQRYADPRLYTVPASALHAGTNVIAVRVDDTGGGGGIYGVRRRCTSRSAALGVRSLATGGSRSAWYPSSPTGSASTRSRRSCTTA